MPAPDREQPLSPLSLAILMAVADEPMHGYAIMKKVEASGGRGLIAGAGSLYAALDRLAGQDWLNVEPDPGDPRRRRRYGLSAAGRRVVASELQRMARLVAEGRSRRLLPEGA